MEDRVFISYAHKDKKVADAICHEIEASGIKCWYAPRDIEPGANWAKSISIAIENSSFFVLVLSRNSNVSEQVIREINLAVKHKLCLVTFRVSSVEISKELDYYLGVAHWMDALTKPLETHIQSLVQYLRANIVSFKNLDEKTGVLVDPLDKTREKKKHRKRVRKTVIIMLLTFVLLSVLGIGTLYLLIRNGIRYIHVGSSIFDISRFSIIQEKNEFVSFKMRILMNKNGLINKHFISDDNTLFAEPLDNGLIQIWKVTYDMDTTEEPIWEVTHEMDTTEKPLYTIYHELDNEEKIDITFSSDKTLLTIVQLHRIDVYDLKSGILRYSYESPTLEVINAKIMQNNCLMTILLGKTQLVDVDNWGQFGQDTKNPIKQVDKQIWTNITTVDISKKKIVYEYNFQYGETPSLYGFTKDGQYVCVYTDQDKTPFLVSTLSNVRCEGVECLKRCFQNVNFAPFDPDGRYYLYEDSREDVRIISLESGKEVLTISNEYENRRKKQYFYVLTNNGRFIRNSMDSSALYDIATGEKIGEIAGYNDWSQFYFYNINHSDLVVGVKSWKDNDSLFVVSDLVTKKRVINNYLLNYAGLPENAVIRGSDVTYTDEGALVTLYYAINEKSYIALVVHLYESELITKKTLVSKKDKIPSVKSLIAKDVQKNTAIP